MPPLVEIKYYDDPVRVGLRVLRAREARGLSRRELSFPGCPAASISSLEAGKRVPHQEVLEELAKQLCVPAPYLAWGFEAPVQFHERLIWIVEMFGSASNSQLRKVLHKDAPWPTADRLPWLIWTLRFRNRASLAKLAQDLIELQLNPPSRGE